MFRVIRKILFYMALGLLTLEMISSSVSFNSSKNHARVKSCIANMQTLSGALEMYDMDQPGESTVADGLLTDDTTIGKLLVEKKYMKSVPQCKSGGIYSIIGAPDRTEISCSKHFTVANPVISTSSPKVWNREMAEKYRSKLTFKNISIAFLIGLLILGRIRDSSYQPYFLRGVFFNYLAGAYHIAVLGFVVIGITGILNLKVDPGLFFTYAGLMYAAWLPVALLAWDSTEDGSVLKPHNNHIIINFIAAAIGVAGLAFDSILSFICVLCIPFLTFEYITGCFKKVRQIYERDS